MRRDSLFDRKAEIDLIVRDYRELGEKEAALFADCCSKKLNRTLFFISQFYSADMKNSARHYQLWVSSSLLAVLIIRFAQRDGLRRKKGTDLFILEFTI